MARGLKEILSGMTSSQTKAAYQEFWNENILVKAYRNRKRFMVILYAEKKDGHMGRFLFSDGIVSFLLIAVLAILLFVGFNYIHFMRMARNYETLYQAQEESVSSLQKLNDELTLENIALEHKNTVLTQAVQSRLNEEREKVKEEEELRVPSALPVEGKAGLEEKVDSEGRPILEFSLEPGASIVATGSGTVLSVEEDGLYGYLVKIDHGNSYITVYRNQSLPNVQKGQEIARGAAIYTVGFQNTLLGYQVLMNQHYINPVSVMEISG
ncbi:MAG: M23 family metallopeptidase [Lachnospiraceae bacterium]|nr:M23 family metallopeptidase [Lachnospiraceae bacterium]